MRRSILARERCLLRLVAGKSLYVTLGYALVVLAAIVSMTVLLAFREAVRGYMARTLGMVPDAQFTLAAPVVVEAAAADAARLSSRHPAVRLYPVYEEEREILVRWVEAVPGGKARGEAGLASGVKRRVRLQAVRVAPAEVALVARSSEGERRFAAKEVRPDYVLPVGSGLFADQAEVSLRDPLTGLAAGPYVYDRQEGMLYAAAEDDLQRAGMLTLVSAAMDRAAPVGAADAFVSEAEPGEEGARPASEAWKLHKLVFGASDAGDPEPAYLSGQLFDAFFESGFDYRTLQVETGGQPLLTCEVVGHFEADLPAGWNGNMIVVRHDAATEPIHRGRASGFFLMSPDSGAVATVSRELAQEGYAVSRVVTRSDLSAAVAGRLRKAESVFWMLAALLLLVAAAAAATLLQRLGAMCRDELFLIRLYGGTERFALALFGSASALGAGVAAGIVSVVLQVRLNRILAGYYYAETRFPFALFLGVAAAFVTLFSAGAVLSAARTGKGARRG